MLLAPARDTRIGAIVQDRYRVLRKLGEGGMGAVYEGEHTVIKRKVAIKCLHAQYATDPEMVARFHREAMATNAIRHPNIVEVTDMGRFEDGAVFMVLEFLEGRELTNLLKSQGALPLSRVVHIGVQVCDALLAAHEGNIVHRDLKPDNIFLVRRGDDPDFVKVLDFGIAKFKEAGAQGITRTGHTMGTPHYMAPEQAQAHKTLDHRADIYSLGVILFHAITGVLPFDDESFPMLMIKVVQYPAPRLRQLVPSVPEALDNLVDRMLAKDPNARPANCAEIKRELLQFREVSSVFGAAPGTTSHTVQGFDTPSPGHTPPRGPYATSNATGPIPGADPRSDPNVAPVTSYASSSNPSMPVPVKSGPPLAWIGGVIALLAAGGLVFALFIGGVFDREPAPRPVAQERDEPDDEPEVDPEPEADPEPEEETQPTAIVQPPPPPPAATVRVQIAVEPSEANLLLDGNPIANPFDADLPQVSEPRRLEARLEGYQTQVRDLSLMYPQRVNFALRRGTGVDDQRRARAPQPRVQQQPQVVPLGQQPGPQPQPQQQQQQQQIGPGPQRPPPPGGFINNIPI
jgi:serine/threonine protein kinase